MAFHFYGRCVSVDTETCKIVTLIGCDCDLLSIYILMNGTEKIFRVDLVTLKIVTNWTSPSPQTEYFSTLLFDFKSTTFDLVDATPSIIFFVLMNSDNTLPGSIFVSTNGKASLKNHVWQHDTEAYWSCAGLDKDGWFKVENVLQV